MITVSDDIAPALTSSMAPVPARVQRRRRETHDTFTLELAPEDGRPWPFSPGQFNMLYLFGVGEVPISISGDPGTPEVLLHTTREVGIVTGAMQQLRPGDYLGLRGPFGSAWPLAEAEGRNVIVIAGGIGLAPLRPVLYHLMTHRERYNRVMILYGARTPDDILFKKDLGRWSARLDVEVFATVDRGTRRWRGSVGVITTLIPHTPIEPENTTVMVCGPEIMMHYTINELHRRGVGSDQIYVSMERNMKCAIGLCGHCQFGPHFVCKDGPVFRFDQIEDLFRVREF